MNGGKQMEIHKRGLPAFVVFPAFPQSGEKHRFALIFCALFDHAKSASKHCKADVHSFIDKTADPRYVHSIADKFNCP
jgi:hypothetical protein